MTRTDSLLVNFRGGCRWRMFIVFGVVAFCATATAGLKAQEEGVEESVDTRVYNIADLIVQTNDYDFRGTETPTLNLGSDFRRSRPSGGMGGGMGGMGGGMGGDMGGGIGGGGGGGGMGGGGGFFNVPEQVVAQVGGAGAGGAVASGTSTEAAVGPRVGVTVSALVSAITTSIAIESWEEVAGPGTIVALGGTLVITQTPSIHKKIDELLKAIRASSQSQRNVTIRATWLLLNAKQLATLESNSAGNSLDRATLERMAADATGYQGQITCFDGQTVHLVAGRARTKIIGAIPVVGGQEAGYQPITAVPQGGAVLQITPRLSADGKTAVIDVRNSVVEADEPEAPAAFLAVQSQVATAGKAGDAPAAVTGTLNIDRVNLLVQQFMTTVRVPTGKPVLLGGLTREPGSDDKKAADSPQLYLFVETVVVDAGK